MVNSHIHSGTPCPIEKTICGLKWMSVVSAFKNISVLILVPPEWAGQRGVGRVGWSGGLGGREKAPAAAPSKFLERGVGVAVTTVNK